VTPGGIEDGVALRFHLMRGARESVYDVPRRRDVPKALRESAWLCATVFICSALAVMAALAGSYASVALLAAPVGISWWLDRRHRRMVDDFERSSIWQMVAYEIVRHVVRGHTGEDGHDVLAEIHRTRSGRAMSYEEVARLLYLSRIAPLRTRLLVLSYLELMLIAHAERLRVDALYRTDRLDDAEIRRIRNELRQMPGRGRRPMSIAMRQPDQRNA
jgi:hypothetical protein